MPTLSILTIYTKFLQLILLQQDNIESNRRLRPIKSKTFFNSFTAHNMESEFQKEGYNSICNYGFICI